MLENPTHLPYLVLLAEEGWGELEDYYPATAAGEMEVFDQNLYRGRNVIWDGIDGRMVRVDPDYITHIWGNIFDADKLAAVANGIRLADDRLVFTAPYGTVSVVTPGSIRESIEYADDEGLDRPLSTGDGDLDAWIVSPEAYLEAYIGRAEDYDTEAEFVAERMDRERIMNELLAEAVEDAWGDLGELTFTVRDGNHRAFGALVAGEPYIWMILEENEYQDVMEGSTEKYRIIREALE
jgi:hypothetical protein